MQAKLERRHAHAARQFGLTVRFVGDAERIAKRAVLLQVNATDEQAGDLRGNAGRQIGARQRRVQAADDRAGPRAVLGLLEHERLGGGKIDGTPFERGGARHGQRRRKTVIEP